MSHEAERVYQATLAQLKPALERVVADPAFRQRLEERPLDALREVGIEPDDGLRAELAGRRFSEFWAARRAAVEGPVETRDLPPGDGSVGEGALGDAQLASVAGGLIGFGVKGPAPTFAPPYVPVSPIESADSLKLAQSLAENSTTDKLKPR